MNKGLDRCKESKVTEHHSKTSTHIRAPSWVPTRDHSVGEAKDCVLGGLVSAIQL
jgi:hypothetical protein